MTRANASNAAHVYISPLERTGARLPFLPFNILETNQKLYAKRQVYVANTYYTLKKNNQQI